MYAQWFDTPDRSILMDPETKVVVGQVVKSGVQWLAYDNDPAKHDGAGALYLGQFVRLQQAKEVVSQIVTI